MLDRYPLDLMARRHPREALLDPANYVATLGRDSDVHIGLQSRVDDQSFPAGYELAVSFELLTRLRDVGAIYGLSHVMALSDGGPDQPLRFSRLEAALTEAELRWLPRVTADPLLLELAIEIAALAARCKSMPDEELLVRVP
jgi:hypothetical protein